MKLKKILPLLDDLSPCKVFLAETEELIFEGRIADVPWRLLECQLFSDKIGVWHKESGEDGIIAYFNIWIIGGR
jgi:hypothetical protein